MTEENRNDEKIRELVNTMVDGHSAEEVVQQLALLKLINMLNEKLVNADVNERSACAARLIADPILSMVVSFYPEKFNKLHVFVSYNHDTVINGTAKCLGTDKALSEHEIEETLLELDNFLRESTGNVVIDGVLEDIVKRREYDRIGKHCGIKQKKGFLNDMRATRAAVSSGADMHVAMSKACRNQRDLEMWMSRFLYSGPLKLANQGYFTPLRIMVEGCKRESIAKEIMTCAAEFNIQCSENDIDYDFINESIQTFCRAKTGWNSPYEYYHWLVDTSE